MNKFIKKIVLLALFVGCCATLLMTWTNYSNVQTLDGTSILTGNLFLTLFIFGAYGISVLFYADYAKVAISFDKPQFCIATTTADDGGSGKYIGLGYSFDIDGHLTADSWFDVDSYTYKIFGITVKQGEANPQKG